MGEPAGVLAGSLDCRVSLRWERAAPRIPRGAAFPCFGGTLTLKLRYDRGKSYTFGLGRCPHPTLGQPLDVCKHEKDPSQGSVSLSA